MKDNINPSHYKQGKVECIVAIESATINKKGLDAVCTANVIKYIWRCEEKGGLEDLRKAKWYLEKMIDSIEQRPGDSVSSDHVANIPLNTTSFSKL